MLSWLGIGVLLALCVLLFRQPSPDGMLAAIPIGSRLADLDRHLPSEMERGGIVEQWVPAKAPGTIHNSFGDFTVQRLSDYDKWTAPPAERDTFTGKLTFFRFSITTSIAVELIYREGKLVKKDWGYLPS